MIISDTTNVNTGIKTEVLVKLKKLFEAKSIVKPQFLFWQHHIFDRILRQIMDEKIGENKNFLILKEILMKQLSGEIK